MYICICIHEHMYKYIYVCIHIYVYMYANMYVYIHVHIYVYVVGFFLSQHVSHSYIAATAAFFENPPANCEENAAGFTYIYIYSQIHIYI